MRIALRFNQVQSRSLATCSTDAIHAYLLPTLPASLNADGRQPICLASAPAQHTLMPHTARQVGRGWPCRTRVLRRTRLHLAIHDALRRGWSYRPVGISIWATGSSALR
jgi:hypothetical protein